VGSSAYPANAWIDHRAVVLALARIFSVRDGAVTGISDGGGGWRPEIEHICKYQ